MKPVVGLERYALLCLVLGLAARPAAMPAQTQFAFRYQPGETYRIRSLVEQTVRVNGVFSHTAEILNRIAITVNDVEDGSGRMSMHYEQSTETFNGADLFQYATEQRSEFVRDGDGVFTIDDEYLVPMVRNVPQFPQQPIEPGDVWTAEGIEVQDFRDAFEIDEVFRFPITVRYRYEGSEVIDGAQYDILTISYDMHFRPTRRYPYQLHPTLITGFSNQRLYWDRERGREHSYDEDYLIMMTLSNGRTISWEGRAEAAVYDSVVDRGRMAEEIQRDIDDLNIPDASVRNDQDGITIVLENIQFPPDSAELVEAEQQKLRFIAAILNRYPDQDILISGHTALAGTAAGRQLLSEQRAAVVGEFLLTLGVRRRDQIMYRGYGAEIPVADNATEAGRRKNRRVEIMIRD